MPAGNDHGAELRVFVPPEVVFPGLQADTASLLDLVEPLSRTDTLFWCARLNLIVAGPGSDPPKERQQRALNLLCTSAEIDRINEFARGHGGAARVQVFFRGQLLELISWVSRHCVDQPGEGETFEAPEVRRQFIRAVLVAAQLWSDRVFSNRFSLDGGIELARRRGLAPIRKSLEEAGTAPALENSPGRGWALFSEYFPRRYPGFGEAFRAKTTLSLEEYFVCVAAITTHYLGSTAQTQIFKWREAAAATTFRGIFPRYAIVESQTVEELAESVRDGEVAAGYRSLREKPILRTADGRAIVLDPIFYAERASVGPLFHLLGRGVSGATVNQIFGAFGLAFEDYVADILRRMYPEGRSILASRLSCNIEGRDLAGNQIEIDALLNDVTELVVFETKAAWLREDCIRDGTHEEYLEYLREKYGVRADRPDRERAKGVAQLARSVGTIANGEWTGARGEFSAVKTIYPVLVVHDALLGAPVYGNFLADEFRGFLDARQGAGEGARGRPHTAPLTVMTIADLENLEVSVENFALRELLSDYSHECADRVRPLHNFIAFSSYGTRMYQNRYLTGKTAEILKRTQERLFPDAS